jgi:hypothetical protein
MSYAACPAFSQVILLQVSIKTAKIEELKWEDREGGHQPCSRLSVDSILLQKGKSMKSAKSVAL